MVLKLETGGQQVYLSLSSFNTFSSCTIKFSTGKGPRLQKKKKVHHICYRDHGAITGSVFMSFRTVFSISGTMLPLSGVLRNSEGCFALSDNGGRFSPAVYTTDTHTGTHLLHTVSHYYTQIHLYNKSSRLSIIPFRK